MKINIIMSFLQLLILHIPFLKRIDMQSVVFIRACVIFHMVQQFLFIWNKGVDPLALGRGKGRGPRVNLMTRHVSADPHMVF